MNRALTDLLPSGHKKVIVRVLQHIRQLCCKAYLVGSWTEGTGGNQSDIDLILVVENVQRLNQVKVILDEFRDVCYDNRPLIDAKVFTEEQLRNALQSLDYFRLWSGLNSGMLLWGESIHPQLRIDLVRKIMIRWLDLISEVSLKIDMYSEFEGACFVLYSALVEFYFIEKHLLHSSDSPITKEEIVSSHFSGLSNLVRREFYNVAGRITKQQGQIKISIKSKRHRPKNDFLDLSRAAKLIELYCDRIYREVIGIYCI